MYSDKQQLHSMWKRTDFILNYKMSAEYLRFYI